MTRNDIPRRTIAGVAIVVATAVLAGCGSGGGVEAVAPAATSNPQRVDARSYGEAWPLVVDSGVVTCTMNGKTTIITFTAPGGAVYALNGNAETARFRPLDQIVDPASAGTAWTLRSLGVRVCTVPS